MLLGERLGRSHQRPLMAVLDRAQHRVERDHRLAAAHLPHQQPLHRRALPQVLIDLGDRAVLIAGRRKGQAAREPTLAQRWRLIEHGRSALRATPLPPSEEQELRQQELLEGEPAPADLEILWRARKVHRRERSAAVGDLLGNARRRRQSLDELAERRAQALHEREDLGRAHALRRRVVRDRAALGALCRPLADGAAGGRVV